MLAVRAGRSYEIVDLAVRKRQSVEIHHEQGTPLIVTRALELFHDRGSAL